MNIFQVNQNIMHSTILNKSFRNSISFVLLNKIIVQKGSPGANGGTGGW